MQAEKYVAAIQPGQSLHRVDFVPDLTRSRVGPHGRGENPSKFNVFRFVPKIFDIVPTQAVDFLTLFHLFHLFQLFLNTPPKFCTRRKNHIISTSCDFLYRDIHVEQYALVTFPAFSRLFAMFHTHLQTFRYTHLSEFFFQTPSQFLEQMEQSNKTDFSKTYTISLDFTFGTKRNTVPPLHFMPPKNNHKNRIIAKVANNRISPLLVSVTFRRHPTTNNYEHSPSLHVFPPNIANNIEKPKHPLFSPF